MKNIIIHTLIALLLLINGIFSQTNDELQLSQQGTQYLNRGMYKRALPIFKVLHERFPERFIYAKNLARCYLNLNQPDEALKIIRTSTFLTDHRFDVSQISLEAYLKLKKNREAEQELEQLLSYMDKQPEIFSIAYNSIANILIRYGQVETAMVVLEKGLKKDPSATYLYSTLGYLARSRMQYTKATEYFLKMILVQKHMYNTAASQILSMQLNKEQQAAVEKVIRNYIKKSPDLIELKRLLIEFEIKYKNLSEARKLILSLPRDLQIDYIISLADENVRAGKYEDAYAQLISLLEDAEGIRRKNIYQKIFTLLLKQIHSTGYVPKEKIDSIFHRLQNDRLLNSIHKRDLEFYYLKHFFPKIGDYDQAISLLKQMEKLSFNPVQKQTVYFDLGYFYRLKNDLKQSTRYFMKIDSVISQKEYNKAQIEILKNRFYQGKWEKLDSLFKMWLIRFDPADTLTDNILRFRFYLQFNLPKKYHVLFGKAILLKEQNQISSAQKTFKQLYDRLSPSFEKAWIGLQTARLAYQLKQNDFNLNILYELSKMESYPSIREEALFLLAENLNFIFEKSEEAQQIYLKILDIFPQGKFSAICRTRLQDIKREKEIP